MTSGSPDNSRRISSRWVWLLPNSGFDDWLGGLWREKGADAIAATTAGVILILVAIAFNRLL